MKKENEIIFALGVEINYLNLIKNMKVVQGGRLFLRLCPMFLKLKLIIQQVLQEQNITVKNVEDTTDIFLTMDQNLLAKDIVIMVYV